ncbi:MAG: hypothetical protein K2G45_08860 [Lachnospiraceae bacterium]|nr:hypothetical protein [Lachnospiraceae bacterium]
MGKHSKLMCMTALMATMLALNGCGKEDKDNIASDLETIGVKTETDSNAESGSIPGHVDYVVEGFDGTSAITVSAEVDDKGAATATVYNVVRKEVDEEFLKQLADGLFDGEYAYIKPYMHCSLDELELEKQEYDKMYNEATGEDGQKYVSYVVDRYYSKLEELIDNYQNADTSPVEHKGLLYHQDGWSSDNEAVFTETLPFLESGCKIVAVDYSRIRGEMDNHTYELDYEKYYLDYDNLERIWQHRYDPSRLIIRRMDTPYIVKEIVDMDEGSNSNQCDYDTALKQAQDVMEDIGLQNYKVVNTEQLYVTASAGSKSNVLNGYEIWFSNVPDGIELCQFYDEPAVEVTELVRFRGSHVRAYGSEHDDEWGYAAGQPYVRITVTDAGVQDIDIGDVYSEPVPSEKKVELLSFENVNEKAKQQMGEWSSDFNINKIELRYMYISYDDINYSLVPVWSYYSTELAVVKNSIQVNALDGEKVEFCENILKFGFPLIW